MHDNNYNLSVTYSLLTLLEILYIKSLKVNLINIRLTCDNNYNMCVIYDKCMVKDKAIFLVGSRITYDCSTL